MSILFIKTKESEALTLLRQYGKLLKKKHNHKKRREVLNKLKAVVKELIEL